MKYLSYAFILIFPNITFANWFCKEASSKAEGDTFYACGHSLANSLIEAREHSLAAAKREFEAFCNEIPHCRDYAYTIAPLRTDCNKEGSGYSCYRGLEYTILPQKRSSMKVDKSEIRRLIKEKERELADLELGIQEIAKLDSLEQQIELTKKADKTEVEIEYLKNHVIRDFTNSKQRGIGIKLIGVDTPLQKDDSSSKSVVLAGIGIEYDTPVWRKMTFKASLSYLLGREDSKLSDKGIPNTNSKTEYHSHSGYDANISLPIWFENFAVSPSLGYILLRYKSTQYNYNNFGVGLEKTEKDHKYNSTYVGLGIRYGKKLFIEIEPRKYLLDSKVNGTVTLGMRVEF